MRWAVAPNAARLDCAQPSSTGDRPVASDALFVLRVAVSIESRNVCVCDADGSGEVVATDALAVFKHAVGQDVVLDCPSCPVPSIAITSPEPQSAIWDNRIDVEGTVADAVSVTCNARDASISDGEFSTRADLKEGTNVIACTALGSAGHARTATVNVTSDLTEPTVTVMSPENDFVSSLPTIDISGSVHDPVIGAVGPGDITVMINDEIEAEGSNGCFLATGVVLENEFNYFDIVATDRVGNQGYADLEV